MTADRPPPSDDPPEPTDAAVPPAAGATPEAERRTRADRRATEDRRKRQVPVPFERRSGVDRRVVADRRGDGKRAGEYDLDPDTLEFIEAMNSFKTQSQQAFPSWTAILKVVKSLGYEKKPRA